MYYVGHVNNDTTTIGKTMKNTNINSYHNGQKYQGLEKDTFIDGYYIEDFAYDHAGNVWVVAIPLEQWKSEWNQETFYELLRVYIHPSHLQGHWHNKQ